jgi:hypothetical protein
MKPAMPYIAGSGSDLTEHHRRLLALVGEWTGSTTTWFEPGRSREGQSKSRMWAILKGHFVVQEYEDDMSGHAIEGLVVYGYDSAEEIYTATWLTSNRTATLLSVGKPSTDAILDVVGQYRSGNAILGWRTIIRAPSRDQLIIEANSIEPDQPELRVIQTIYNRMSATVRRPSIAMTPTKI